MTRGVLPVEREWRVTLDETRDVVKSVSAAVPAPAHLIIRDAREMMVPYVWSDVVNFLAVFVCYDGTCSGSCVCA